MGQYKTILFLLLVGAVASYSENVDSRSAFDQDLYERVLDEAMCEQQLNFLSNNSLRYQFLDASAKFPTGINAGNLNDLGDYFLCLGIDEIVQDMSIQGKYCTVTVPLNQDPIDWPSLPELPGLPNITWPEIPRPDGDDIQIVERYTALQRWSGAVSGSSQGPNMSRIFPMGTLASRGMTIAVCVPKVCSATQAIDFVQSRFPFLNITFEEYYCRLPRDKPFVAADYVAMSIFSLIAALIVLSTTYDLSHTFIYKRGSSEVNPLYRCFSVYTNTRRFLTFSSPKGALECVDGIRAISMMWVIVGHTHSMTLLVYVHNLRDIVSWLQDFSSIWINSAPITVDTFFMLSGILAVYTVIGKISRPRFVRTLHLFYLNRLLRMFPLLAAVVLLQASLFNHISDGPVWINVANAAESCRQYWWSALLHVQNYVNSLDVCLVQTWYLSVDMQLYLFCPVVLVWLFGAELWGWIAITSILLLSLVSSSLYSYLYNFSAALANFERINEFNDYVSVYYMNTLTRAPPFFVGMAYGYLLHLYRNKRIRIPKIQVAFLWVLSFLMMAFCIFTIYPVMQPGHSAQGFDNFLNAYMRAIWALGLGWLIFACVQGYGGPINWFLSLKMWKLPARLSYAMYLIHVPIIMVVNGSWVKTHYFQPGETFHRFMGDVSLTFVAAFLLCIAIDAPFSTLQKLLLGGGGKRPQKNDLKSESQETVVSDKYIKTTL